MEPQLQNLSKPLVVRKNPCLKSTTDKLYEQRHETGDIRFVVGSEEIPAHRCVLAALSPRYKAQFYGAMAEQNTINVQDVSPAAFKEFLQFFYLDEVTLTLDNIEDVLNLAKQSLVDELVTECTNFLLDVVGMDKLIWFYRLAIDYEVEPLEEFCSKRISEKIQSIVKTPEFLNCEQEMLCRILDMDSLNCNEIDVFDACVAWAREKCEHGEIQAANMAQLRAALGNAIFKIRFCSMTAEQFADINEKYPGLLLLQESVEVFQTISLKGRGKTSSMFGANNSKPRKPIQSIMECSFSKGSPDFFMASADFLDFACDKAILLHGFVICNKIDDTIAVQVKIEGVSQIVDFTKSTSDDETRIIFNNPIHIAAKMICRIDIEPNSFLGLGFRIEGSVLQNGVSFKFCESHSFYHSLTRLLFNNIE